MKPEPEKISNLFALICEYGYQLGLRDICKKEELVVLEIDSHWKATINPTKKEISCIPAWSISVDFNGWPAGIISAGGGIIAAGSLANEDTLTKILKEKIKEIGDIVETKIQKEKSLLY